MDGCGVCRWPATTVSIKFLSLVRAGWPAAELRQLSRLADAAMLPRTPRP